MNNQTYVAHKGWPCQWVPAPLGTIVQEEPHTPDQQMEKQAASAHQGHTVVSLRLQAFTLLSGNCQQSFRPGNNCVIKPGPLLNIPSSVF